MYTNDTKYIQMILNENLVAISIIRTIRILVS